jgi:hypothetical protein
MPLFNVQTFKKRRKRKRKRKRKPHQSLDWVTSKPKLGRNNGQNTAKISNF